MSNKTSSPEQGFNLFKSFRRTFAYGIFGVALGVSALHESVPPQNDSIELNMDTIAPQTTESNVALKRADSVNYGFSMSVDCLLSFGGAKQLDRIGLSREKYLPLEMAMKQGGGLSDIFLMGQRAPGEKEGGRITDGLGVVYDKGKKQYYIYSISTADRIPEAGDRKPGEDEHTPVPYIIGSPLGVLGMDDLMQGVRFAFNNMNFSMKYEPGNPYGPLHFSLDCRNPNSGA